MKKILLMMAFTIPVFTVIAQEHDPHKDKVIPDKIIEIPVAILGIYLAATFILKIIKMVLDNRLKYKLLEKGVSADVVKEFLQPTVRDTKNEVLKWTVLFTGICAGLIISYFFQPYGNHTVAILAFSIAVSYLIYYNFFFNSFKK